MKTAVEKQGGKWVVRFTQGNQTFTLFRPVDKNKKDEAEWQQEMLDICFDNFKKDIKKEYPKSQSVIVANIAKCDVCGCHPSVIIRTQFGQFCQAHVREKN